ncbi:hypothetical protein [Bradyrhizobium embrapense]
MAIITGAASGIGRASAELFFERGARGRGRRSEPSRERIEVREPGAGGGGAADGSAERAVAAARERFGRLDSLSTTQAALTTAL